MTLFKTTEEEHACFPELLNPNIFNTIRTQEIVVQRQICMKCLRNRGCTLHEIGLAFCKDHSTVSYSIKQIEVLESVSDIIFTRYLKKATCFYYQDDKKGAD